MTKTKTTAVTNPEDLRQYRQMTGEAAFSGMRMNVPVISVSYKEENRGKFVITRKEGDIKNIEVLGETIEVIRIRARSTLRAYISDDEVLYTPEYDSKDETIPVFNNGSIVVPAATPAELRKHYFDDKTGKSTLKMNIVLYVLVGDELAKLYVKGASLASLFSFYQSGSQPKEMISTTKLSLHQETKGAVEYYVIDFAVGDPVTDVAAVLKWQKDLHEGIMALKESLASKKAADVPDTVKGEIDDGEELDVSKIPF